MRSGNARQRIILFWGLAHRAWDLIPFQNPFHLDTLIQQGGTADNQLRMAVLTKMTGSLILQSAMTSQLTLHISKVYDRYPGNPDELFDVLVDRAENILRKAGFNQHTAPKAMAVDNRKSNDDKRDSKKQKKQPFEGGHMRMVPDVSTAQGNYQQQRQDNFAKPRAISR